MKGDRIGLYTLTMKEVRRFWSVLGQTVTAPVVTALLYLMVFAHVLAGRPSGYEGISYTQFLLPGLIMMSVMQNAFANTSSSLTQSKIMGSLVFVLMAPLAAWEFFAAYILAALLVALAIYAVTLPFIDLPLAQPLALLAMFLLAGGTLAVLGLIAGIIATKFDHLAAFQNFVVMPLTFLSGVFYSVHSLPPFWYQVSHLNPFFYMIDGFRFGFFGIADVSIWQSLAWALFFFLMVSAVALRMLASGYRLRA
jgi:ABC-2 type transport system permease protein